MSDQVIDVVIYSADSDKRAAVMNGIGRSLGKGFPTINWIETATSPGAIDAVQEFDPPIVVLDAETPKVGGMAVAREIANQLDQSPLVILLTARPQDQWLATWSGAAFTVYAPYDPRDLQDTMITAISTVR